MTMPITIAVLAVVLLAVFSTAASPARANDQACPNAAEAPMFHKLMSGQNVLFGYLSAKHGTPVSCTDGSTTEFDGEGFGALELTWESGLVFSLQSLPPEIGITRIKNENGLDDEAGLRATVQKYVSSISSGIDFDWSSPDIQKDSDGTVEEFVGRPEGMNAIVRYYKNGENRLTEISISFAP